MPSSEAQRCTLEQVPGLKQPESIRFPLMRKYLATVVQVDIFKTYKKYIAGYNLHSFTIKTIP